MSDPTVPVNPASGERRDVSYDDVVVLTAWMAAQGYTSEEVAYAVEKPWKHLDELEQARAAH